MSSIALKYPKTGQGGTGEHPPVTGGGGGDRGGSGCPNYGARLRRARLGLAVGLTSVTMMFVSFTSAYIVRQGLATLDGDRQRYDSKCVSSSIGWTLMHD